MLGGELLKKIGEETLYSAKGHFKAGDLRRQLVTLTIWGCALLDIVCIIGLDPSLDKWLSATGLFGTIALLIWNEGEGKNYRSKHKEVAERYLALHKEIRSCYFLEDCDNQRINELVKEVSLFDQTEKPEIPGFARRWAKRAIERKDPETDNWFLKE